MNPEQHPTRRQRFSIGLAAAVIVAVMLIITLQTRDSNDHDEHADHRSLMEAEMNAMPGMDGDKTKRYTLDVDFPKVISPNSDARLAFTVYDASSGNQVVLFKQPMGKPMHLIIVDSTLTHFDHIHPEFDGSSFVVTARFPRAGKYHLYADFQPFGGIEQQIATSLVVGNVRSVQLSKAVPEEPGTQKTYGDYTVRMDYAAPLSADEMAMGMQKLSFTLTDTKSGQPITTLKPYLEAFGHLVMINQETFDYVHVHPADTAVPAADANGGPTVEFMPMSVLGPIKPGVYRAFAQFNPDGKLFTSDFTVEVK